MIFPHNYFLPQGEKPIHHSQLISYSLRYPLVICVFLETLKPQEYTGATTLLVGPSAKIISLSLPDGTCTTLLKCTLPNIFVLVCFYQVHISSADLKQR